MTPPENCLQQAIALAKHPSVKPHLKTERERDAFIKGYMLAQVCSECGTLFNRVGK